MRSRSVLSHRRRRQGGVDRLSDSRPQIVEPFLGMVPVHDAPNESKLGCNVDTPLLQLVEKEPIVVRLPAQLKYIENRREAAVSGKDRTNPVLPRFVLELPPDPGDLPF